LFIPEIHCSSCIYLLEQLHKLNTDILSSRVSFQRRELSVTIKKSEDALFAVFNLIHRLGYTPTVADKKKDNELHDSRSLLIKIGITGFCFGNIMLLSIPEYISGRSTIEPEFQRLFNILIILLIIPAMYFGAKDYFSTAWKNLKHKYLSVDVPIILGIGALFIRSMYEIFEVGDPGYLDSLSGFLFFLLIGKWFQSRTYEHLSFDKDFKSFLPLAVLRKIKDVFKPVRVQDLKKGDIIKLRNHEILPVNAQLLDDTAEFDYSFVTGESAAIIKQKKDVLFAGGKLNSHSALFMVNEAVNESYLQDLWKEQDGKYRSSKLINLIDKVSQRFTITIILIALVGLAYWSLVAEMHKALEIFTAILIVACPCALALAAPFTYGNAGRLLSRIDIYLKNTSVIESLGRVRKIVFDKTGTLTQKNDTEVTYEGQKPDHSTLENIVRIASCSIHPLSKTLVRHLDLDPVAMEIANYREVSGAGIFADIANEHYLIGSHDWMKENGFSGNFRPEQNVGRTRVYVGVDDAILGFYEFSNVYREGILSNVRDIGARYPVSIISGDGNDEEQFLRNQLGIETTIAFDQSPDDKYEYIAGLRRRNEGIVMMLGDGINDAKALKESDIGVAITEDTGSFTPNSDIIMHADSLVKLPDLLHYGKDCRNVLYLCLAISLLYNVIGLSFAFSGLLTPFIAAVLMPVSSISVVLIATGLTTFYAKKRKVI